MATKFSVRIEQLVRLLIVADVEAESDEDALVKATDSQNWLDFDEEENTLLETRPVSAE